MKSQFASIETEIRTALDDVLKNTAFALGPAVKDFEAAFAEYCQTEHCVAVSSGTSALHVAMACLGIGPGDEVILPSMSFVATAWPVLYLGARPIFVDIDPRRYTLDPELLEAAITPQTKAIVPVHLYGQCADMDAILAVADAHGVPVVEDAAQAHGATYKGRRAGSLGRLACFSFYPGKNLGAYGEGGAVVTNDAAFAERARILRDHGQSAKYKHDCVGYNYRMDGFQGAVLGVKLKYIDAWNAARRAAAARYDELLTDAGVTTPPPCADGEHVYHVYAIMHSGREALRAQLQEAGVGTNMHYPIPIHLQSPFAPFGYKAGDLPVTEVVADSCLSLPMYPELRAEQQQDVAGVIRQVVAEL